MIFEMLTGRFLFKPSEGKGYTKDDDHLALMMEMLGKLPKKLALSGRYSRNYYNKDGKLKNIKKMNWDPLKAVMENEYNYSKEEAQEISDFLLPMLTIDPEKRISAFDALKSDWLWTD